MIRANIQLIIRLFTTMFCINRAPTALIRIKPTQALSKQGAISLDTFAVICLQTITGIVSTQESLLNVSVAVQNELRHAFIPVGGIQLFAQPLADVAIAS